MTSNLKTKLLLGAAVTALSFGVATGAQAADTELAGTTAAPTDVTAGIAGLATSNILNAAATNNDAGQLNANGGVTAASINSDQNGTLGIYDGTTGGDDLTITTFADVASGTTLNLVLGAAELDGTGGTGAADTTITTTLGEAGATTLTRGGTLAVVGAQDSATGTSTVSVNGNTLMTAVNVTGGLGATTAGHAVTTTFGDASTDTFDSTGVAIVGGAGSGATNGIAGGAATATVNGTASIGAGNLAVTGGDAAAGAGTGAAGGNSSLTFANNLTITGGATTVTGGADHNSANGAGGDATLTFSGNVTSDSTLLVSTGTQNAGGGGLSGDGTVNFAGNATFTAITMNDNGDGASTINVNGTSAQTIAGTINGVGGAEGVLVIDNAAGATFSGTIGNAQAIAGITIEKAAGNSSATFQNTTNGGQITLGGDNNAGDVNTVTFDSTTQAFTVTGAIAGAGANETNNIVVTGDDVITFATASTANLDNVTVSGTATLTTGQNLQTSGAMTVGSGTTLATTGNTLTAAGGIANSGTLQLGGGSVAANVTGAGALDVNNTGAITGTVAAASADIAGGATLTQNTGATYNVATTTFSGAGTLAFDAAARTVTGNFTNTTDGQGTITVADGANTTAFVGNLGTSTSNSLAALNLAGGTANVVTLTGNLFVDATDLVNAANTLQFIGTSAQTASGTIDGPGILTVGNGTDASDVTFNDTVGVATTALSSASVALGSTARFNANTVITGAYAATGTTHVGEGATFDTGTTTGTGGFVLDATDANGTLATGDIGRLDFSGSEGALARSEVTINATGLIGTGTVDVLVDAGDAFADAGLLSDNSALQTFTAATNGTITVANVSTASITENSSNAVAADALLAVTRAASAELDTLQDAVAAAGTATVNDVIEATTSPNLDGGAVVGGLAVTNSTANITSGRLASLRDGTAGTGVAAGEIAQGLKAWGQVFGTTGTQDERDGVSGFDVDTVGFAAGIDTEGLAEDWVWGLALTYAETEVESDSISNAKTDIDTYQLSLYGDYDLDDRTYVSGQLGYAWSENDTTRNPGGVSTLTARGDFDSEQITARIEAGRDYEADGGTTLTPSVLVNYNHYDVDSYTETGAGGANLIVDGDSLDILEIGVGLDASWTMEQADGSYMKPELRLGVRHDLIGDEVEATNTFTGGGAAFKTEGFDPAQTTFNAGAGVTYFTTDNWELTANYDFEYKSDYDAHSGYLKAAYKF